MKKNKVCVFFYVNGQFLIHGCELKDAEVYGDFLIYPKSHFEIWERRYAKRYQVDFDYYPRGRVAYHTKEKRFHILYDQCVEKVIHALAEQIYDEEVLFGLDEHYQCHRCNKEYL